MRVVMPAIFRAIEAIAGEPTTVELTSRESGVFPDAKLDALILAARAVMADDDPMDMA